MKDRQHRTRSGYELKAFYAKTDLLPQGKYAEERPGGFPFTRGIRSEMYRDSLWIMGQYSGFASAEEANQRYKYLISQGQTGFSIALDLPTQMGLDSDAPLALGEVGKVGVAIDTLADIEALFDGIDLSKVRQIRTTANANSIMMLALYVAYCRKKGIDPGSIGFFLQNDPLKEYICRGTYIYPPEAAIKLTGDVIEYCAKHYPKWTPIAVSGYHIREAGATAAQEIAFTFANLITYMDESKGRGVSVDDCARNIYIFASSGMDLIEEVAKFRAARRVYAQIMRDRYGVTDTETQRLKIFVFTSGSTLTAEQPLNNIARVTIETLAAVAGGVQTISSSSYDEALSIPTEEAVTVSLRTQQIVAYESGITETVDIFGGSYVVEHLTDVIEQKIWEILEEVENLGGAVHCIKAGYFQKRLADNAYVDQRAVDDEERIVVGVNRFRDEEEVEIPVFELTDDTVNRQKEKLERIRASRDNTRVQRALTELRRAALENENLGDALIEACDAYASIGEMTQELKAIYGVYQALKIY